MPRYSFGLGKRAKCPKYFFCFPLSFSHVAILYIQSLSFLYSLSLSPPSALNNLSCNATPGAVLNLLLLAEGPRNINKLRENNGRPEWASYQNCCTLRGGGAGRRALHFLFYCRESSIFSVSILHISIPVRFSHFPTFLPCYLYHFRDKQRYCYEWYLTQVNDPSGKTFRLFLDTTGGQKS